MKDEIDRLRAENIQLRNLLQSGLALVEEHVEHGRNFDAWVSRWAVAAVKSRPSEDSESKG